MLLTIQVSSVYEGFLELNYSASLWNHPLMLSGIGFVVIEVEGSKLKSTFSCRLVKRFEDLIRADSLSFSEGLQLSNFPFTELLGTNTNRFAINDQGVLYVTALACVLA